MGYENSGRRPQPTALTVLRGNPSKKKLNENEPCPPAGDAVKPAGLTARGGVVWDRLAPLCLAMGTLTCADTETFAALCELRATMVEASSQKDVDGFGTFTVAEDYNGAAVVKVHAAIKLERETATALRPYLALFGLEPVSRARISVPRKPDEPKSKWAGALG